MQAEPQQTQCHSRGYEMKFFPVGMKTGIGLSAAALLTTVVYIPLDHRRRKATPAEAPADQNA